MSAPLISMNPVASSSIGAYGYDAPSRTLALAFKGGRTYRYADVPQATADGIRDAKSVGAYVSKHVVGKYQLAKDKQAKDKQAKDKQA